MLIKLAVWQTSLLLNLIELLDQLVTTSTGCTKYVMQVTKHSDVCVC